MTSPCGTVRNIFSTLPSTHGYEVWKERDTKKKIKKSCTNAILVAIFSKHYSQNLNCCSITVNARCIFHLMQVSQYVVTWFHTSNAKLEVSLGVTGSSVIEYPKVTCNFVCNCQFRDSKYSLQVVLCKGALLRNMTRSRNQPGFSSPSHGHSGKKLALSCSPPVKEELLLTSPPREGAFP